MDNSRGFHHAGQRNFERGGGGQGAMMPEAKGRAGMAEPTNHGGVTHEVARRREHDARVEGHRAVHAGKGQGDHEKILHDTHKLHQGGGFVSHGNKHGEAHHYREEAGEGHSRDPAKFMREEAAERRRGEE
jgi:hypothetical protein